MATETRSLIGANNGAISKTVSYEYNLDNSLKVLHYPSGAAVTYTPDSAGQILSAVDSSSGINYVTGATYDATSALTGFVSGSGGAATFTNTFTYNKRLQPLTMSATAGSQTVFSIGYDFHLGNGDNGNVFGITNYKDQNRNQTFTYDGLNRLTSAWNAGSDCGRIIVGGLKAYWGNNYIYDAWGNLTSKSKISTACAGENLATTASVNNQLGGGYVYDIAGNMTYDPTPGYQLTYTFDQENRITGVAGYAYTYDGDGNRVRKSNGNAAGNGTLYWYMSPGVVAETDLAGTTKSEYVFFDGERVARRDGATGTGGVFYYFSDHLKTASVITDSAGIIKAESDYYPWGGELPFIANDSNDYKFTGKKRDTETGLDYFGARYYSNGLGRWVSADWSATPIPVPYADFNDPQTFNLYQFVGGNPASKADPDGHDTYFSSDKAEAAFNQRMDNFNAAVISTLKDVGSALKSVGNFLANANASLAPPVTPGLPCTCPRPETKADNKQNNNNSLSTNQNASGGKSNKGPNPNGRNGDATHQAKIGEVEKDMQNRGLTTKREYKIDTPEGEKSSRYVDVVGKDAEGNVVEMHQVGKQTQSGNPVARETRALNDIEKATGNRPEFHPTNKPKE